MNEDVKKNYVQKYFKERANKNSNPNYLKMQNLKFAIFKFTLFLKQTFSNF